MAPARLVFSCPPLSLLPNPTIRALLSVHSLLHMNEEIFLQDSYRVIGPQMGNLTSGIKAAMMRAAMQAYSSLFHLQVSAEYAPVQTMSL